MRSNKDRDEEDLHGQAEGEGVHGLLRPMARATPAPSWSTVVEETLLTWPAQGPWLHAADESLDLARDDDIVQQLVELHDVSQSYGVQHQILYGLCIDQPERSADQQHQRYDHLQDGRNSRIHKVGSAHAMHAEDARCRVPNHELLIAAQVAHRLDEVEYIANHSADVQYPHKNHDRAQHGPNSYLGRADFQDGYVALGLIEQLPLQVISRQGRVPLADFLDVRRIRLRSPESQLLDDAVAIAVVGDREAHNGARQHLYDKVDQEGDD
mmetsp:Transcript_97615/g.280895  ORF Transcript_97615/g.280895 Transcript_97615/m.280895 type:complete len:268 (-) Transcript_97615:297-1100(-)